MPVGTGIDTSWEVSLYRLFADEAINHTSSAVWLGYLRKVASRLISHEWVSATPRDPQTLPSHSSAVSGTVWHRFRCGKSESFKKFRHVLAGGSESASIFRAQRFMLLPIAFWFHPHAAADSLAVINYRCIATRINLHKTPWREFVRNNTACLATQHLAPRQSQRVSLRMQSWIIVDRIGSNQLPQSEDIHTAGSLDFARRLDFWYHFMNNVMHGAHGCDRSYHDHTTIILPLGIYSSWRCISYGEWVEMFLGTCNNRTLVTPSANYHLPSGREKLISSRD